MKNIDLLWNKKQVAILGINNVFGKATSLLLKHSPVVNNIILYDDNNIDSAKSLQEVNPGSNILAFKGVENLGKVVRKADIIIIGNGSETSLYSPEMELDRSASKLIHYATVIAKNNSKAIVIVAATPLNSTVPLVTETLKTCGVTNLNKVMGLASMDSLRARTMLANHLGISPNGVYVPVVGGSSPETRVPLFSHAKPSLNFDMKILKKLTSEVKTSDRVLCGQQEEGVSRAFAAVSFLHSIMDGLRGEKNIREIVLSQCDIIPGTSYFSLPVILGENGIQHRLSLPPLNDYEAKLVSHAISTMAMDTQKALRYLIKNKKKNDTTSESNENNFKTEKSKITEDKQKKEFNEGLPRSNFESKLDTTVRSIHSFEENNIRNDNDDLKPIIESSSQVINLNEKEPPKPATAPSDQDELNKINVPKNKSVSELDLTKNAPHNLVNQELNSEKEIFILPKTESDISEKNCTSENNKFDSKNILDLYKNNLTERNVEKTSSRTGLVNSLTENLTENPIALKNLKRLTTSKNKKQEIETKISGKAAQKEFLKKCSPTEDEEIKKVEEDKEPVTKPEDIYPIPDPNKPKPPVENDYFDHRHRPLTYKQDEINEKRIHKIIPKNVTPHSASAESSSIASSIRETLSKKITKKQNIKETKTEKEVIVPEEPWYPIPELDATSIFSSNDNFNNRTKFLTGKAETLGNPKSDVDTSRKKDSTVRHISDTTSNLSFNNEPLIIPADCSEIEPAQVTISEGNKSSKIDTNQLASSKEKTVLLIQNSIFKSKMSSANRVLLSNSEESKKHGVTDPKLISSNKKSEKKESEFRIKLSRALDNESTGTDTNEYENLKYQLNDIKNQENHFKHVINSSDFNPKATENLNSFDKSHGFKSKFSQQKLFEGLMPQKHSIGMRTCSMIPAAIDANRERLAMKIDNLADVRCCFGYRSKQNGSNPIKTNITSEKSSIVKERYINDSNRTKLLTGMNKTAFNSKEKRESSKQKNDIISKIDNTIEKNKSKRHFDSSVLTKNEVEKNKEKLPKTVSSAVLKCSTENLRNKVKSSIELKKTKQNLPTENITFHKGLQENENKSFVLQVKSTTSLSGNANKFTKVVKNSKTYEKFENRDWKTFEPPKNGKPENEKKTKLNSKYLDFYFTDLFNKNVLNLNTFLKENKKYNKEEIDSLSLALDKEVSSMLADDYRNSVKKDLSVTRMPNDLNALKYVCLDKNKIFEHTVYNASVPCKKLRSRPITPNCFSPVRHKSENKSCRSRSEEYLLRNRKKTELQKVHYHAVNNNIKPILKNKYDNVSTCKSIEIKRSNMQESSYKNNLSNIQFFNYNHENNENEIKNINIKTVFDEPFYIPPITGGLEITINPEKNDPVKLKIHDGEENRMSFSISKCDKSPDLTTTAAVNSKMKTEPDAPTSITEFSPLFGPFPSFQTTDCVEHCEEYSLDDRVKNVEAEFSSILSDIEEDQMTRIISEEVISFGHQTKINEKKSESLISTISNRFNDLLKVRIYGALFCPKPDQHFSTITEKEKKEKNNYLWDVINKTKELMNLKKSTSMTKNISATNDSVSKNNSSESIKETDKGYLTKLKGYILQVMPSRTTSNSEFKEKEKQRLKEQSKSGMARKSVSHEEISQSTKPKNKD